MFDEHRDDQFGGEAKEIWQEMEEEKPCQEALEENSGAVVHDGDMDEVGVNDHTIYH